MQIERLLLPGRRWAQSHVLSESPSSSGRSPTVQDHVIIIPGNPGVASFYLTFAERLHATLGGRCSVRALNLAGFVPGQATQAVHQCNGHDHVHVTPAPLYSLADQCEFLTLFLTALHLQLLAADEDQSGDAAATAAAPASGDTRPTVTVPAAVVRRILSPVIVASALPASSSSSTSAASVRPRRQHRFILVAHSIGSYIALAAMRRAKFDQAAWDKRNGGPDTATAAAPSSSALAALGSWLLTSPTLTDWSTPLLPRSVPALCIHHSFLVAPFVRMDLSWLEFRLTRWFLAQHAWLPPYLASLLRLLPFAWYRALLRLFSGIRMAAAVRAAWDVFSCAELMRQFSFLGHTEFQFVLPSAAAAGAGAKPGTVFDPAILAEHRAQLSLLYAGRQRDIWGPLAQMYDFQAAVPQLNAKALPQISHAWCAFQDEIECVVGEVTKQMDTIAAAAAPASQPPCPSSHALTIAAPAPTTQQLLANQLIASRL